MSRRTLLLVVVLALLALGVAWIATRGPDSPATADAVVTTSARPSDPIAQVDLASPPAPIAKSDATSASPRSIAQPTSDFHAFPADARWIEGRVEFPTGTPRDERVFVVATGKKVADKTRHRFEVDANGNFRAAFGAGTKNGTLGLEARYLFLVPAVRIDPRENETVVLAPKLGGLARVRLVPSAIVAAARPDFTAVKVQVHTAEYFGGNARNQETSACDEHGVAELGGLDASIAWRVEIVGPKFDGRDDSTFAPKPGEVVDVDLPITLAARFAGTVVDARGEPVHGAEIRVAVETEGSGHQSSFVRSTKEGTFEAFVGEAGTANVSASSPGRLGAVLGPFEIREGLETTGLEFRLAEGLAIDGVVRWSDGRPAAGVTVKLTTSGEVFDRFDSDQSEKTAEDGTFRFTGLVEATPYALSCRERQPPLAGQSNSERPWWTASRTDVIAGARGLELVLVSGNELRGRVVDDLGAAVLGVVVAAEPTGADVNVRRSVRGRANDDDGTFVLAGVADGDWNVGAARKGEKAASMERVVLPRDSRRELRLVVPRAVTIAGRVLDVDGKPAASARVVAQDPNSSDPFREHDATSGSDGTFRLERLPAGKLIVSAGRDDRADSAELTYVLACGDEATDAELTLRRGGTIEGRVLDAEDRPLAGASIGAHAESMSRTLRSTTTLPDGTYRMENVAPGTIRVWAYADRVSLGDASKTLLVVEGETTRVDFGGRPQGRILVRGLVHAGKPIAGARVNFFKMDGEDDHERRTVTDASGRYEIRLVGPGNYWLVVDADAAGQLNRNLEVPDVADQVMDFDLGAGRIAGRVLGPDGKPVANATVRVHAAGQQVESSESNSGHSNTAADGAFAISGLSPGTYELVVDPPYRFDPRHSRPDLAPRTVSGIVLEAGGSRTDLEIRLDAGARLVVRVRSADGRPAAGANVRWQVLGRFGTDARTDAAGVAQLGDVPPGEVTVQAWSELEMTREPVRAVATRDTPTEVSVQLVAGGGLLLRFVRKDGSAVLEPWTVQHGVSDADQKPADGTWREPREGGALPKGPLAPGRYDVWARIGTSDVKASVQVTAGVEVEVTLRDPD